MSSVEEAPSRSASFARGPEDFGLFLIGERNNACTLVWMNTAPDGTRYGEDSEDCEAWTNLAGGIGSYGGINT